MSAHRRRVHNWPFRAHSLSVAALCLPRRWIGSRRAVFRAGGYKSDGLRSRVTDVFAVCRPTRYPSPCSDSAVMTRGCWETGSVWVADDFAAWLVQVLADAGRRKLTDLVLGDEFGRALGKAATAAILATARDLRGEDAAGAEFLAAVLSEIFAVPVPAVSGRGTVLEALQAGIAAQLAGLDDPGLTGSGGSAAAELGISPGAAAAGLTGHLLDEIVSRGARC